MKQLQTIFLLTALISAPIFLKAQTDLSQLSFLEGTWKRDGKESYESWKMTSENEMRGTSYRVKEGQKRTVETLKISPQNQNIVYEATVMSQNGGKAIPFTLNPKVKDKLSFENLTHDFPNMIQYQLVNEEELLVNVLGNDGKGFSFKMKKIQ